MYLLASGKKVTFWLLAALKMQVRYDAYRKSKKGRKVDALAHRGDEGRDKLR